MNKVKFFLFGLLALFYGFAFYYGEKIAPFEWVGIIGLFVALFWNSLKQKKNT